MKQQKFDAKLFAMKSEFQQAGEWLENIPRKNGLKPMMVANDMAI